MSEYSVQPFNDVWQVLKDGRFFCTATSERLAHKICASLQGGRTPQVGEFTVDEMIEVQAMNEKNKSV